MITIIVCLAIGFALGVVATAVFGQNNKNKLAEIKAAVTQAYAVGDAKVQAILGKHTV
jgi:hypothetical protein